MNTHTGEYRRRKYILPLAVATVLLTLGSFIGASYFISVYAAHKATANAVSLKLFCESSNAARHDQIHLWDFIIHLDDKPPPGQTKAQHKLEVNRFEAFLNKTYAPRDCSVPFNPNK